MKQCNFCSRTLENPKVNILYKGILNAHICDYCLKDALKNIINQAVDNIDFKPRGELK